jgi:hypothetical protein
MPCAPPCCCAIDATGGTTRAAWCRRCLVCLMEIESAPAVRKAPMRPHDLQPPLPPLSPQTDPPRSTPAVGRSSAPAHLAAPPARLISHCRAATHAAAACSSEPAQLAAILLARWSPAPCRPAQSPAWYCPLLPASCAPFHPAGQVLPPHVDVRTQALYQMLYQGFVGLIFSVFNNNSASKGQQVQVRAASGAGAGQPQRGEGGRARQRPAQQPNVPPRPLCCTSCSSAGVALRVAAEAAAQPQPLEPAAAPSPPTPSQVTAFQSVPQSSQLAPVLSAELEGLDSSTWEAIRASAAGGRLPRHPRSRWQMARLAARLPRLASRPCWPGSAVHMLTRAAAGCTGAAEAGKQRHRPPACPSPPAPPARC